MPRHSPLTKRVLLVQDLHRRPRPQWSLTLRVKLALAVHDACIAATESFEPEDTHIGAGLSYLMAAILREPSGYVEWGVPSDREIERILLESGLLDVLVVNRLVRYESGGSDDAS